MPLQDGYGVLIGNYADFTVDDPADPGLYYHGHIFVTAPSRTSSSIVRFDCAVDVNQVDQNIQYFTMKNIKPEILSPVVGLADGYHPLQSNSTSGALDYVRNKYISEPLGCAVIFSALWRAFTGKNIQVWKQNVGGSALNDLRSMLNGIQKMYIFGAPFRNSGNGMHDIHFNQGNSRPNRSDPRFNTGNPTADTALYNREMGWYLNNGVWQDGAVIMRKNTGVLEGFFVKFVVQSMNTNNTTGNPL